MVGITAIDVEGKERRNKVNASSILANFIGQYNHVI
jgi:hypothetical protein